MNFFSFLIHSIFILPSILRGIEHIWHEHQYRNLTDLANFNKIHNKNINSIFDINITKFKIVDMVRDTLLKPSYLIYQSLHTSQESTNPKKIDYALIKE